VSNNSNIGKPAGELVNLFQVACVLEEELAACMGARSKSTKIGNFLGPYVDREVPIEYDRRQGTAVLRRIEGRSNQKKYYFEVCWNEDDEDDAEPQNANSSSQANTPVAPVFPAQMLDTTTAPAPIAAQTMTAPPACAEAPSAAVPNNPTTGNSENW
jgi:hypothetical protein